jgi:Ca2+-binding RTX toxin-like protein
MRMGVGSIRRGGVGSSRVGATLLALILGSWLAGAATATAGSRPDRAAPGAAESKRSLDLHNDDFVNAQAISGTSGSVSDNNTGATGEPGEPNNAHDSIPIQSLWYKWTVPSDATWSFDTCGSSFDTTIGVYIGSKVDHLKLIATSDDDHTGACGLDSRAIVQGYAGAIYRISIDGYAGKTGNFTMNWSIPTCTIDGTPGPDFLNGTSGNDVICGRGGNDVIAGSGGNDTLLGGPGDDQIRGEDGSDYLVGNSGVDTLQGGPGFDNVNGVDFVRGNDSLDGGVGLDLCYGDPGDPVQSCE